MSYNKVNVNVSGPKKDYTSTYKTYILRGNMSLADQVTEPNMKYLIKYDFDLNGGIVTIPEGCLLEFDGGSFNNGVLNSGGNIEILSKVKCFDNITFSGLCKQSLVADLRWFVEEYPSNTSDTNVDNTNEVRQCLNCGTYSVLFPTDRFIRLTETVEISNTVNILTRNESNPMTGVIGNGRFRNQEKPCVFSDNIVTLFHFHLGSIDEVRTSESFIIGNITLATMKLFTETTEESFKTPVLKIDNSETTGTYFRGIRLDCNITALRCQIDSAEGGTSAKGDAWNWTGVEINSITKAIEFIEINGDLCYLGIGFNFKRGGGSDAWFTDVIVRGHTECCMGGYTDAIPLIVYGTHQTLRMHPSCRLQNGYFKSGRIYLFGFVWDCNSSVSSNTGFVVTPSPIESTDNYATNSFIVNNWRDNANNFYYPTHVKFGQPLNGELDLRKMPNLLYTGLGNNYGQSGVIKNLVYKIKFEGDNDYVDALEEGVIKNSHCLFNDKAIYLYRNISPYPSLDGTPFNTPFCDDIIDNVRVSFELNVRQNDLLPYFLLIESWAFYGKKKISVAIKSRKGSGEYTEIYSEENPLVLDSSSAQPNYYWRLNLTQLGILNNTVITIEVDYSTDYNPNNPRTDSRHVLPFISIPWPYGEISRPLQHSNDKIMPILSPYNKGWNTFNTDKMKPLWWNGSYWVSGNGLTDVKTRGQSSERPTGLHTQDVGFRYYDEELNKPIYAMAIDEAKAKTVWMDAMGNAIGYNRTIEIELEKGKGAIGELEVSPTIYGGKTNDEIIEMIGSISDINACFGTVSTPPISGSLFEVKSGDLLSIVGVGLSYIRRLYYIVDKATGKISTMTPGGNNEYPDQPYRYILNITSDSWVIITAFNEDNTKEIGGETVPTPYNNKEGIPFKVVRFTNEESAAIPTYGLYENRPALGLTDVGFVYFATDLGDNGRSVWWNGTTWVDATGATV